MTVERMDARFEPPGTGLRRVGDLHDSLLQHN
ncbi:Uncharacterised protein [Serratia fonticola]|nr:Uncharacterised protein [Serratia fonticola]